MIPKHVSEFLRAAIPSTWALDTLRLLKKSPHRVWTSAALNAELRGSLPMIEDILAGFRRWGLVLDAEGGCRYATENSLDATVDELVRLYAERPVSVIAEIARSPHEKLQTFVDAFRVKKDEKS